MIGFVIHFLNGWWITLVYILFFHAFGFAKWWLGAWLGVAHTAFVLLVVFPNLPGIHPRMASDESGLTPDAHAGTSRILRAELRHRHAGGRPDRAPRLRCRAGWILRRVSIAVRFSSVIVRLPRASTGRAGVRHGARPGESCRGTHRYRPLFPRETGLGRSGIDRPPPASTAFSTAATAAIAPSVPPPRIAPPAPIGRIPPSSPPNSARPTAWHASRISCRCPATTICVPVEMGRAEPIDRSIAGYERACPAIAHLTDYPPISDYVLDTADGYVSTANPSSFHQRHPPSSSITGKPRPANSTAAVAAR